MSQQPGWYDDPQDIQVLRYWDGVAWTNHTSPRQRPNLDQTRNARMDEQSAYGGSPQQPASRSYRSSTEHQSMPGGGFEDSNQPQTPDGQPVAGWWRRFFARILDAILISVLTYALIPVVAPDFLDTVQRFVEATINAAESTQSNADLDGLVNDIAAQSVRVGLTTAVLSLVYEIVFLKRFAATPGKLALGLRVRLRDEPGPLTWSTSGIRGLVWHGPSLLGAVPAVGLAGTLFQIVNGLWPLWDAQKQSLNDKAAKTNVVHKG